MELFIRCIIATVAGEFSTIYLCRYKENGSEIQLSNPQKIENTI